VDFFAFILLKGSIVELLSLHAKLNYLPSKSQDIRPGNLEMKI
jgi:hypothetical protein